MIKSLILAVAFVCAFHANADNILSRDTIPAVPTEEEIIVDSLLVETATHIFWQPDIKLLFENFSGAIPSDPLPQRARDEFGINMVGSFGLWGVLDLPGEELRNSGMLMEKVYIVPAFERISSFRFEDDSLGLKVEQLVFDAHELGARLMRKNLHDFFMLSKGSSGAMATMFSTFLAISKEQTVNFYNNLYLQIYVNKREDVYEKSRLYIDEMLEANKEYATTMRDAYRFVKGEPIDEGYILAPTIVEDLRNVQGRDKLDLPNGGIGLDLRTVQQ